MMNDELKNDNLANTPNSVLASEKNCKKLIAEIENELGKLVCFTFNKFYQSNGVLLDRYARRSHDCVVWQIDADTSERIGVNVEAKATLTDNGWRTYVRLDDATEYATCPACICHFTFDIGTCADDHLRSSNTIETFNEEFYKANLDEYVSKKIAEQEAVSALVWLQGFVMHAVLTDGA
jgi:hypothetical protein